MSLGFGQRFDVEPGIVDRDITEGFGHSGFLKVRVWEGSEV